jgi:bifunctional ADP-heptose synthase (sugar kinase/adenylyltransferase)
VINEWLDAISEVKPYILGEFILDEYSQCSALSKSSKDPILAFERHGTDSFIGGAAAIAHNIGSWGLSCSFALVIDQKDFEVVSTLERELPKSVHLDKFFEEKFHTIRKHRFVDTASRIRLFEYYDYSPRPILQSTSEEIVKRISSRLPSAGPLIVADYGHGFFNEELISWLEDSDLFLAVNTQANAGNRGYNTISKYGRADFICLNGGELELEFRKRNLRYEAIVPEIIKAHNARNALVTLGGEGMIVFGRNEDFVHVPALAINVVDKVGAGDAVLSIAALLSFVGAPIEVIGILASIVAAHEVSQLGHKSSLSVLDIKRAVAGVFA